MANVNQGHRERLRQRYIENGIESLHDHEVLELLLFQYLPYKDTNKIAHDLINTFGSFANVLDASPEQLVKVKGVSTVTACNISMLKAVWNRYKQSSLQKKSLKGLKSIMEYAQTLISDESVEKLVAVFVDNSTSFISSVVYTSESTQRVYVDIKTIVGDAIKVGAAGVMLFHCHVKGDRTPSKDDVLFTEQVYMTLASINMVLLEHIIFSGSEFYSFLQEGYINEFDKKYTKIKEDRKKEL